MSFRFLMLACSPWGPIRSTSRSTFLLIALVTIASNASGEVQGELQCSPEGVVVNFPTTDEYFSAEVSAWFKTTKGRYLHCQDIKVADYDGYPTKRCRYSLLDAGTEPNFTPLRAEVVWLNPSAKQLASWSINACRINGAAGLSMKRCLSSLMNFVILNNSATFPVAGSVVESYCNSSQDKFPKGCKVLEPTDRGRAPRNTWFRDGISVDYQGRFAVRWDETAYAPAVFDRVFNVSNSDIYLSSTKKFSRPANATREQWKQWRDHVGKTLMPEGTPDRAVEGKGWQSVSREVLKAACKDTSNELFNAVVYANRSSWIDSRMK